MPAMTDAVATTTTKPAQSPGMARRVLVLQGGGALGSYQAGAYDALCTHGFDPVWVAGISIGAINAAIIAGNPKERRVARLKEFWELVSSPVLWRPIVKGEQSRTIFNEASAAWIATFGVPGFFTPRVPPAPLWPRGTPQAISYYDTAPLRETLERLVDFDLINAGHVRLSVGAVNVRSGNFAYFDSARQKIGPEHIMASGALPPGFPPVEVDGEHYWDGGLVSNTPLDYVLAQEKNEDLLVFQVDLFSARGPLPDSILEATEREKDIRYSSRTRLVTDANKKLHNTRKALRELIARLPADLKADPLVMTLSEAAKENTVTVMHLIYKSKIFESGSKDFDFSRVGMVEHWRAGEEDVRVTMQHPECFTKPQAGETMVTYDVTGDYAARLAGQTAKKGAPNG
jgi:NTE family protein